MVIFLQILLWKKYDYYINIFSSHIIKKTSSYNLPNKKINSIIVLSKQIYENMKSVRSNHLCFDGIF